MKLKEIKFKFWNTKYKIMSNAFNLKDLMKGKNWNVADIMVCRSTGITDMNGDEIYEGDVLEGFRYPYSDEGTRNYVLVVEWIFNGWQGVLRCVPPNKAGISEGMNSGIEETKLDMKIIGNIYETPEFQQYQEEQ